MTIKLLPPSLQNQIAAGEVVERPASIIKELVENSIDAQAENIRIEIEEGGVKKIRIIDDGKGMNKHDAQHCFTRYSTSKISKIDDLFTLSSFGFRGEALASIASISHMTLKTKQKSEKKQTTGIEIIYKAKQKPEELETIPCSMPTGTEILIENVFWNVPARKKFLKTESTEAREIVKIIENFALSNPHISFRLKVDGKEKISVQKSDLQTRAKNIIGKDITDHFLPLIYQGIDLQITGFTTDYNYHRSNRTRQYIFVNNRIISSDSLISSAVSQAYETLLPRGKFPSFLLHITIRPDEVDVNVHPRKTQVKFLNTANLFKAIKQAFSTALNNTHATQNIPQISDDSEFTPTLSEKQHNIAERFSVPTFPPKIQNTYSPSPSSTFPTNQSFQQSFIQNNASHTQETGDREAETEIEDWKVIGQVRKSFIIVEEANGMRIVDQHAAHERVRLEMLTEKAEKKEIISQPLLTPCIFSLSQSDKELLLEQQKYLLDIGFEIEDFGNTEVAINSVPSGSEHIDIAKLFQEILDSCDFFEPEFASITDSFAKKVLSYAACRGAKMFGDYMSQNEMEALIRDWKKCKKLHSCAHGRPVSIFYPFNEIEKKCGRC